MHAEVQRLQRETMQREVDACNEAGRARALAQADQQVSAERKRLEERVAALTRERDEQAARLRDTTLQLEHARERTAGKAERAEAEREAHARQEAHMDAALAQCRRRLVARTRFQGLGGRGAHRAAGKECLSQRVNARKLHLQTGITFTCVSVCVL